MPVYNADMLSKLSDADMLSVLSDAGVLSDVDSMPVSAASDN